MGSGRMLGVGCVLWGCWVYISSGEVRDSTMEFKR